MEKVKEFAYRLMANPVFWIAVVLCSLAGFINVFERYTAQVGFDGGHTLF